MPRGRWSSTRRRPANSPRWILELKSLKYYLISWRDVGAAQEDVTALLYADLAEHLGNPQRLVVETVYTVRGGINTTCRVDSRDQD